MTPEEAKADLAALVVGFLQQTLNDYPKGMPIRDLERLLPDKCDEEPDWYSKRYKKKTALEALQTIPEHCIIRNDPRYGPHVSLNTNSDLIDQHLIDLIQNQRQSSKKRRGPPRGPSHSERARNSFRLNRLNPSRSSAPNYRSRLNQINHYIANSHTKRTTPASNQPRPSIYNEPSGSRAAPGDPRSRNSMVPPQVKQAAKPASKVPTPNPVIHGRPFGSVPRTPVEQAPTRQEDPIVKQRKTHVAQRIVSMLTRNFSEIKVLDLARLYSVEYNENLDLSQYGYNTLTALLRDPVISESVELKFKSPWFYVIARAKGLSGGKENIASVSSNRGSDHSTSNGNNDYLVDRSNTMTKSEVRLDAVDPFNIQTMLQSLRPIEDLSEPKIQRKPVESIVKYRTLRIIFKSEKSRLKLDDWERKFEQESRFRICVRDYGFKTLLEFFKHLAIDMPIHISLDRSGDNWIAEVDMSGLSEWLNRQIAIGCYRSIAAIDASYELIAYPDDVYTYAEVKEFSADYIPSMILSMTTENRMFLQLRTPKTIEDHLLIESSLTCYEDYRRQNLFKLERRFVREGFPCAVFDENQQRWCRGLVLETPRETKDPDQLVETLLVDYGITKKYAVSQISCLMKNHLKHHKVGLLYSKVHGILNEVDTKVKQRVRRILQEFKSPVTLACQVVNTTKSGEPNYFPKLIHEVILVDTTQEKDRNIADFINIGDTIQDD